jgi:hypothetical protein
MCSTVADSGQTLSGSYRIRLLKSSVSERIRTRNTESEIQYQRSIYEHYSLAIQRLAVWTVHIRGFFPLFETQYCFES